MSDRYAVVFNDVPKCCYGPFESIADAYDWAGGGEAKNFDIWNFEYVEQPESPVAAFTMLWGPPVNRRLAADLATSSAA